MDNYQFKIKDKLCDVIATYNDEDTNKNYIVYTDETYDKENKLKLYYSLYKIVDNNIKLIDIDSIEDKNICLQLVRELIKDIENEKM